MWRLVVILMLDGGNVYLSHKLPGHQGYVRHVETGRLLVKDISGQGGMARGWFRGRAARTVADRWTAILERRAALPT